MPCVLLNSSGSACNRSSNCPILPSPVQRPLHYANFDTTSRGGVEIRASVCAAGEGYIWGRKTIFEEGYGELSLRDGAVLGDEGQAPDCQVLPLLGLQDHSW